MWTRGTFNQRYDVCKRKKRNEKKNKKKVIVCPVSYLEAGCRVQETKMSVRISRANIDTELTSYIHSANHND